MKISTLVLIIIVSGFLNACISNNIAWKTNNNIKQVEIGMDKARVIQLLGDQYMITSSSKDHSGNVIEVLTYKSDVSEEYQLRFVNNKLMGWDRNHVLKYIEASP